MINQHITIPYDEIAAFCQRHHVRTLSLFGSVLRDDFRPDSDVDVLVEFERDAKVTYLDMAQMEFELADLLKRPIDLRESQELSRYFRQEVIESAQLIYERD